MKAVRLLSEFAKKNMAFVEKSMPDQQDLHQSDLWQSVKPESHSQSALAFPPTRDGSAPETWMGGVHPDGFLELSKGFYLYADRLSKILAYLAGESRTSAGLYAQLAQVAGLSEARVKALVQIAVYTQLLTPRTLLVTDFGRLILKHDPFLDRGETLWLLHYLLASNPLLVVWNFMCNSVLPGVTEIEKPAAAGQFQVFAGRWSESSLEEKTRKELRTFFDAYANGIFARLGYLRQAGDLRYVLPRETLAISPRTLLACTLIFRDRFQPGSSGLEIAGLAYAEHSPGRLLRLSEGDIRRALDTLHESGLLTVESKANLDQARFRSGMTWLDAIAGCYEAAGNER